MSRPQICSLASLIGIAACSESMTEVSQLAPPAPTIAPCTAGLVLSPGQSCAVSDINFTVRDDGSACLG